MAALALGLMLPAGVTSAQEAAPTPQGEIVIPDGVTIYGKNDPNHRRATAVVNGEIITGTDVDQRLALILASAQQKPSDEEIQRLKLQILRNLIDETLEIQEAKAHDITVEDSEIEQSYNRVAAQSFRQNPKALDAYLAKIGSAPSSLKRQIKGELAWQHVLRRQVEPFINVSEDEVKDVIARMQADKGTEEYRIGEIYLAASDTNHQAVDDQARQIIDQLQKGGSFAAYARQYSQASTAAVGGDLGWIRLSQLPTELAEAAKGLTAGQLVGPVEVPGGFSIIILMDKRQVLTADPRDAILSLKQISLEFPAGTLEADATKRTGEFASAIKGAHGCGAVDAVAAAQHASVVANDQVRVRDLPPQLQNILLSLSIGETSPPFGSMAEGVRVLMLCGRDDPKVAKGPNPEQLEQQIQDERVNKRAQAYLRDLRRDAVIEYN